MGGLVAEVVRELQPVCELVRDLLVALPRGLRYHAPHHTFEDVYPATLRLAEMEGVGAEDMRLLGAAALFHDTGYLDSFDRNEPMGAARAREALPGFGFNAADLDRIDALILATCMPQSPRCQLAQVLCDADLQHLGTEQYFLNTERLRLELASVGRDHSARAWHERNLKFLAEHRFFTESARALWRQGKVENLEAEYALLGRVMA